MGAELRVLQSTTAEDIQPSLSPNGDWLAYTSNLKSSNQPQIWTVNTSGTLPTQLREGESPCVSIDGEKIVFSRTDNNHSYNRNDTIIKPKQIWIMNKDGSGETQISQNTDYDISNPRWSPDGKWIIYSCDKAKDNKGRNNYDIWCIKSDGTSETQLTTNGSVDDCPYWGIDGFVYFRSNRGGFWNIWRVVPILPN
ncbi:MAG: PD40 domain-containing protein [Bacteroidetes bacterium]|nr:PD40 domain-containing protein [Bacteroidota bacterium]